MGMLCYAVKLQERQKKKPAQQLKKSNVQANQQNNY
jgi:hypothetical protein